MLAFFRRQAYGRGSTLLNILLPSIAQCDISCGTCLFQTDRAQTFRRLCIIFRATVYTRRLQYLLLVWIVCLQSASLQEDSLSIMSRSRALYSGSCGRISQTVLCLSQHVAAICVLANKQQASQRYHIECYSLSLFFVIYMAIQLVYTCMFTCVVTLIRILYFPLQLSI